MDFSDEQSPAVVSLSVFIQSDSEVRKIDSLTLTNVNSSLSWTSRTIELLQGKNNKFWAGYSNFKAVQGTFFPQGRYTVLIEDKAGNESESSFILNIPEEIKKGNLKSIRAYLSGNSVQFLKNIAIYDGENNLLFLGEENENFSTDEQFIKKYPEGVKKRPVYLINGGTVTILFPSFNAVTIPFSTLTIELSELFHTTSDTLLDGLIVSTNLVESPIFISRISVFKEIV